MTHKEKADTPAKTGQFELSLTLAEAAASLVPNTSHFWGHTGEDGRPQVESLRVGISGVVRRKLAAWVRHGDRLADPVITREGAFQTSLAVKLMYVLGLRPNPQYRGFLTKLGLELVAFIDSGGQIFGKDWQLISDDSGVVVSARDEEDNE